MRHASSTLVLGTNGIQEIPPKAHVVKLVNTLHSGCSELKLLEVRVFSWAQKQNRQMPIFLYIHCFQSPLNLLMIKNKKRLALFKNVVYLCKLFFLGINKMNLIR